jgi:surfactin synthase thioesterase subunit
VETARRLQQRGVQVQQVFVAAQLLGDAAQRRANSIELSERSDADIAAELRADSGYIGLAELDAERAEHVGAGYRHDYLSANRYFADVLDNPSAERLAAPVTVVVAADDPITSAFRHRYRDWELLAEHVDLYELPDGGHHFIRSRPAQTAQMVLHAAELFAFA